MTSGRPHDRGLWCFWKKWFICAWTHTKVNFVGLDRFSAKGIEAGWIGCAESFFEFCFLLQCEKLFAIRAQETAALHMFSYVCKHIDLASYTFRSMFNWFVCNPHTIRFASFTKRFPLFQLPKRESKWYDWHLTTAAVTQALFQAWCKKGDQVQCCTQTIKTSGSNMYRVTLISIGIPHQATTQSQKNRGL
jgi:hypothetical protein